MQARRWREMGLKAAKGTEDSLSPGTVMQIIADQMALDPSRRVGQNGLKKQIALNTGIHLKRETIAQVQKMLDPEGVVARHPTSRKIKRVALTSVGPNEVWSCDGHDKLIRYGFAIWGLRDKFSRKWLGLWVVPNNRSGIVVAYLWLSLIREMGGMPRQSSTDCGTENTIIYGLVNALKDAFGPHGDPSEKPAHLFLRSVHNIVIEQGWLDFRQNIGHKFPHFCGAGAGVYEEDNPVHRNLAKWLWPPLMQKELDSFRHYANNHRIRKQKDKRLPSGVTPSFAYTFPEHFGGEDCLQPVDMQVIEEILEDMKPKAEQLMDWGVPPEFEARAQAGFDSLEIKEVTITTVWVVFTALLHFVS